MQTLSTRYCVVLCGAMWCSAVRSSAVLFTRTTQMNLIVVEDTHRSKLIHADVVYQVGSVRCCAVLCGAACSIIHCITLFPPTPPLLPPTARVPRLWQAQPQPVAPSASQLPPPTRRPASLLLPLAPPLPLPRPVFRRAGCCAAIKLGGGDGKAAGEHAQDGGVRGAAGSSGRAVWKGEGGDFQWLYTHPGSAVWMVGFEMLLGELEEMFGKDRVVELLEIRFRDYLNTCYHHLASACQAAYNVPRLRSPAKYSGFPVCLPVPVLAPPLSQPGRCSTRQQSTSHHTEQPCPICPCPILSLFPPCPSFPLVPLSPLSLFPPCPSFPLVPLSPLSLFPPFFPSAARALFNRAAVYIASHGAAMANLVFMPSASCVLEIRPREYLNACYHHLASASQQKYFLVFGSGTKDTPLEFHLPDVLPVLKNISDYTMKRVREQEEDPLLEEGREWVERLAEGGGKSAREMGFVTPIDEGSVKEGTLSEDFIRAEMDNLHLNMGSTHSPNMLSLECPGNSCPDFSGSCDIRPDASACTPAAGWRDEGFPKPPVPVNCPKEDRSHMGPEGRNETCTHAADFFWFEWQIFQFEYKKGTKIRRIKRVVNLVYRQASSFYHGLIEWTPQLLLLASTLHTAPTLPLLAHAGQWDFYQHVAQPLLGNDLSKSALLNISDGEIYFAEEVYVPLYQACGKASPSIWTDIRHRFLLPPKGLPVFRNNQWDVRHVSTLNSANASVIPPDWLVVVARRPGTKRALDKFDALLEAIKRIFGHTRVQVFDGSIPILSGECECVPPRSKGGSVERLRLESIVKWFGHTRVQVFDGSIPILQAIANMVFMPAPSLPHILHLSLRHSSSPTLPPFLPAWNFFRRPHLFVAGHGAAMANMVFMPANLTPHILHPSPHHSFSSPRLSFLLSAQKLFRRARLFVAGHGAAMANMVFMPANATVLEIRPDKYENACYHHLAYACELRYYLTFGKGDFESQVQVDLGEVSGILQGIKDGFAPLPGPPQSAAPLVAQPCPALPCLSRRPAGRRAAHSSPCATLRSPPRSPLQPARRHLQPARHPLQPARRPAAAHPALPTRRPLQPTRRPFAAHHAALCSPLAAPWSPRAALLLPTLLRAALLASALLRAALLLAPPGCCPPCYAQPCCPAPSCPRRPAATRPAVRRPAGRPPAARAPPCWQSYRPALPCVLL
ncbi:unnamed protein product [Closterium sp. NIES-54]